MFTPGAVTTPADPQVDVDLEFVVMGDEALEKPFRVIIHNDDVTPFDFVIAVLLNVFELDFKRAEDVTYEAHTTGQAVVCVLPYEEASHRVYVAQSAAREFGYPLAFTLEPDE